MDAFEDEVGRAPAGTGVAHEALLDQGIVIEGDVVGFGLRALGGRLAQAIVVAEPLDADRARHRLAAGAAEGAQLAVEAMLMRAARGNGQPAMEARLAPRPRGRRGSQARSH